MIRIMDKKSAFLMAATGALTVTQAHAGTETNATIAQLVPSASGFTFITSGGVRTSPPSCAAPLLTTWAVDVTTPQGQAIVATVITAYSMGKKIYISGTGSCPSFQPNGESVFFIATAN